MTMMSTMRNTDETLLATCRALVRKDIYGLVNVVLPDGTEGYCYATQILSSAVCDTQGVKVRQGKRCDLWFPSQLKLA